MKRIILLASLLCSCCTMFAQLYEVKNVVELKKDLTARIDARKDATGQECAFIRVDIPTVKNVKFVTETIGETINLPGEYGVFIPVTTNSLSVMVNNESYNIDFAKYGITIVPKTTYRVVMNKVNPVSANKSAKVGIKANYDNVIVLIDGKPVGQTPLVAEGLSLGKHIVSVPNASGVTMKDMTINVKGDTELTLDLHKERVKDVSVDMATPGGDTAGWYEVFGTTCFTKNGLMGVKDYTGEILVPCKYDYVFPDIQNGYYRVWKDNKIGLYDPSVGLVVPCIYDNIETDHSVEHDSYMVAKMDGKVGLLNPDGKVVIPMEYKNLRVTDNFVCAGKKGGRYGTIYGLLNLDGDVVLPFEYEGIGDFCDGYAFYDKDKSSGLISKNGDIIPLPDNFRLQINGGVSSGVFPFRNYQTKESGYMNLNMDIVISMEPFEYWPPFNNGVALIETKGDQTLIDNKGNEILRSSKLGCKIDVYDNSGSEIYWDSFGTCFDGKAEYIRIENSDGKCGILNLDGKEIIPCKYSDIYWTHDDGHTYFEVTDAVETKVLNENGETLITLPVELSISEIKDGFVKVTEETGAYGYLNLKGDVIANCIYGDYTDDADVNEDNVNEEDKGTPGTIKYSMERLVDEYPISEGLAILKIGDRMGLIDVNGKVVLPLEYTGMTPFENGIAYVRDKQGIWKKIKRADL